MAEKIEKKGIDISRWQGVIDFEKLKDKVDFVIIKAGGSDSGFYEDKYFRRNVAECKRLGIPIGCYYFVGRNFTSSSDGRADAIRFAKIIKGIQFEYPVYLDIETTSPSTKNGSTYACIEFCKYMESQGYYVGIYSSAISGFKDRLVLDLLKDYDLWVASWGGKKPTTRKQYGMWQNSSTGKIEGINGNVDTDIAYYDFPSIIVKNHLNNF